MIDILPPGWKKVKLNNLATFEKGVEPGSEAYNTERHGLPYLRVSDLNGRQNGLFTEIKTDKKCLKDEILIALDGSPGIVVRGMEGIFSSGIRKVHSLNKEILSENYLFHLLQSSAIQEIIRIHTTGSTILHAGNSINFMEASIPSDVVEQDKISEILTTVDDNIQETDNIIEGCEVIKRSLMETLLTRGIPGKHKKFKPSKIGEIPEEWELKKLTEISSKIGDGLHSTPKYVDSSDYYFINGNNLLDGSVIITDSTKCVNEEEFKKYYILLNDRTILMSINGTIGNLAYFSNEKVILGKSAAYINLDITVDKKYIYYLLQTPLIKKYYDDELTGTTIRNLSLKSIRNTPVPLPSITEQQEISEILLKIDERISLEKKKSSILQINKQALTQKLLSGEMRVKV